MGNGALLNFVGGAWVRSSASDYLDVINPATAQAMTTVPMSPAAEVDDAVQKAATAFVDWRRTPVGERIQPLFKLKALLDAHKEDIFSKNRGQLHSRHVSATWLAYSSAYRTFRAASASA